MGGRPNILVTGTPGTGKTTFSTALVEYLNEAHEQRSFNGEHCFKLLSVNQLISENQLYTEWDNERDCSVYDEDKVHDKIQELLEPSGGYVLDFHSPTAFDMDWFDIIVLLRASTEVVYDRLMERNYDQKKVEENVQCEIFDEVGNELAEVMDYDGYTWTPGTSDGRIVMYQFDNNTPEAMKANILAVINKIKSTY